MTQTPPPFPARPHEYFHYNNVRLDRHPDLTLELRIPGLYWPGQVDPTWILFRDRVQGVVTEILGEGVTVTMDMATVSGSRSEPKIEEFGTLKIRGPRETIQKLATEEGASELASALDALAVDCGGLASSLDEQDQKLHRDISTSFNAYGAGRAQS